MTSRLVCTAEMDLPADALEAAKAQAGLLEIWKQFSDALPEQGLKDVRTDARVVKAKAKSAAKDVDQAPSTQPPATQGAGDPPAFLKRT